MRLRNPGTCIKDRFLTPLQGHCTEMTTGTLEKNLKIIFPGSGNGLALLQFVPPCQQFASAAHFCDNGLSPRASAPEKTLGTGI